MIAYHITSKVNAKKILKEGFVEKRNSFTRKKDVKWYLRHPAFLEYLKKPVVLEVEVPKSVIVKKVLDRLFERRSAVEIITRTFRPDYVKIIK